MLEMRRLVFLLFLSGGLCYLWPNGVVHYAINKKDYDVHSQDVIQSALSELQREVCVKFFHMPTNYTATVDNKILFVSNPDKRKDCPPGNYDFSGSVVDMPIGYRCINKKDIARIVVDMLRASVDQLEKTFNSFDLIEKFKEKEEEQSIGLLTKKDREYINSQYHLECGALSRPVSPARRVIHDFGVSETPAHSVTLTEENWQFYGDKLWPLGIVMYGIGSDLSGADPAVKALQQAMSVIERATCIVFQEIPDPEQLAAKNFLWFSKDGEDMPELGFKEGNQTVSVSSVATPAPGHSAAALDVLLRALGVPMMSNRYDRDNYVRIVWKNVQTGKEHLLEKTPEEAWIKHLPYDFSSASHAPANYMCAACNSPLSCQTVVPLQDHLWQKTLSMGHRSDLSESDTRLLSLLYSDQCRERLVEGA